MAAEALAETATASSSSTWSSSSSSFTASSSRRLLQSLPLLAFRCFLLWALRSRRPQSSLTESTTFRGQLGQLSRCRSMSEDTPRVGGTWSAPWRATQYEQYAW